MLIILGGDSISKTTIQYEIVKMAYFNTHTRPHLLKIFWCSSLKKRNFNKSTATPFFKNVSVPVPVLYAVSDFWGIKKALIRVYQYRKIHRNVYENPVVALTCHAFSAIIYFTKSILQVVCFTAGSINLSYQSVTS